MGVEQPEIAGKDIEGNKKTVAFGKIIEDLIEHYVDEEGNLLHYDNFSVAHNRVGNQEIEEAYKELNIPNSLNDIFVDGMDEIINALITKLRNRLESSKSLAEKLKISKIMTDLSMESNMENANTDFAREILMDIFDDETNSYFFSCATRDAYLDVMNFNYNNFGVGERVGDESDSKPVFNMHEAEYNGLHFNFSEAMLEKLSRDNPTVDYGTPGHLTESSHVYHLESDGRGDYITRKLSPDAMGIFSVEGNLIAWQSIEQIEKERSMQEQQIAKGGKVAGISTENIMSLQDEIEFDSLNDLMLFKILSSLPFRRQVEEDLGIDLSDINMRTQYQFLQYVKEHTPEQMNQVKDFVQQGLSPEQSVERMKTFFSIESDQANGDRLFEMATKLDPEASQRLFSAYSTLVDQANQKAFQLHKEMLEQYPDEIFTEKKIYESLLARASALIIESYSKLQEQRLDVDQMIEDLEHESVFQEVLRMQFVRIAKLLSQDNVDLAQYQNEQEMINQSEKGSGENDESVYLRALNAMGKLKPLPELYWRVDRNSAEYDQRLGVDIVELMKNYSQGSNEAVTVLEFGPGSGIAKHERSLTELDGQFEEFAMSDALYYDLANIIEQLIDFKKLEAKLKRPISSEERKSLVEYVKATILIKSGETGSDEISYDEETRLEIEQDPNKLKSVLLNSGEKLKAAEVSPTSQVEERAEGPRYVEKFKVSEQSAEWQEMRALLIDDIETYLRDDFYNVDAYELLDVHPAGIMIGDFEEVSKLNDDQIDLALGVRSTVYVERDQYAQFILSVYQKLKEGGLYIDDNVRENFGNYYRIQELIEVEKKIKALAKQEDSSIDFSIYLILGPGIEGEDYRQEDSPLAIVVGKGNLGRSLVEGNLMPNCRIIKLDDVAADQKYLQSLSPDISEPIQGGLAQVD